MSTPIDGLTGTEQLSAYYQLGDAERDAVGQLAQQWKLNVLDLKKVEIPQEWSAEARQAAIGELILHWRYELSGKQEYVVRREELSDFSYKALQIAVVTSPLLQNLTLVSKDSDAVRGLKSRRRLSLKLELQKEPSLQDFKEISKLAVSMRTKEDSGVEISSPRGTSPSLASPRIAARLTEGAYVDGKHPRLIERRRSGELVLTRRTSAPPKLSATREVKSDSNLGGNG